MALTDIYAAFRWWIVLMIFGVAAMPLTFRLLQRLPDRGYTFTKMIGLLITSYIFWLLASIGFLNNDIAGIIVALLVLLGLSVWAWRSENGNQASLWLRHNWQYILLVEIIFASAFILWALIRAQNPAISSTEKPMEFAFLNSVGRSPQFPPLDPWLSGFAISYYYFGYVMSSVITRMAIVPEQIGFNLSVAWLAAGTSLGAFGLVFNLISASKESLYRRAFIFALIAAVAIPVAGNMEILLEVAHANELGPDTVWEWLDVRDLSSTATVAETPRYESSQWWWWRSSRVIHEYRLGGLVEEGLEPIAEFPSFSFILGDLHPHVLALPFAFLNLAIALTWWIERQETAFSIRGWLAGIRSRRMAESINPHKLELLLFTGLVLGGLSFLNTWDVLIHLFVIVGAYFLARWRLLGKWSIGLLGESIKLAAIFSILAIILYLPFYFGFRSQAGPPFLLPMTMRPTRLVHFLIIFALPVISILILLGLLLKRTARWKRAENGRNVWLIAGLIGVGSILFLGVLVMILGWIIAISPAGEDLIVDLANQLGVVLAPKLAESSVLSQFLWATVSIAKITPAFLVARATQPALVLLLVAMLVSVIYLLVRLLDRPTEPFFDEQQTLMDGVLPFGLLLLGTGVLLALGPEFVYLKDVFGQRLNTIFKFYYQAWILFGTVAVYGLDYLLKHFRVAGVVTTSVYGVALFVSLLFPWFAVQSRSIEYRGPLDADNRTPATLDGLAYLERFNPDDLDAILWIRQNLNEPAVIVEAVGGQYTGYARVSSGTGVPTILGWPGHEYQWRGETPEPGVREPAVEAIYSQLDWQQTTDLLDQYDVDYIYYGSLERDTYDPGVVEKFSRNMEVAYSNDSVSIYRWHPSKKD